MKESVHIARRPLQHAISLAFRMTFACEACLQDDKEHIKLWIFVYVHVHLSCIITGILISGSVIYYV